MDKNTYQNVAPYIKKALQGEGIKFESTYPDPNNQLAYLQIEYIPSKKGLGNANCVFVLTSNITERVNMEHELKAYRNHLEELVAQRTAELKSANDELDSFCYLVSHDLRAPLRGIHGFSKALEEDYKSSLDATGVDYLQRIQKSVTQLNTFIDELLGLSKLAS